jgi:hypothetical protein
MNTATIGVSMFISSVPIITGLARVTGGLAEVVAVLASP